jgi:dUTP pyrophosphatase
MKVLFKKLIPEAELPTRGTEGSSGYDVKAVSNPEFVQSKQGEDIYYYIQYRTGLAIEVPHGYETQARPRSSISKTALILANSVATIDSDYRGEILIRFKIDALAAMDAEKTNLAPTIYKKGDKICQLVFQKVEHPEIEMVEELSDTDRGVGGFGSTGK